MPIAFSTVDWWIVGVYMLIATVPGFLCRKYIHGQDDFLLAGRTLSIWLATATLTATEMGLITVMYMAEMGFKNGFSAMVLGVIALCTTMFIGLTGFMVSGLRKSGATTVAEYYEQRYSRGVRVLGGFIIAAAGILNYGVFLKVEANFIKIITGVPDMYVTLGDAAGAAPIHIPSINLVMSILVAIVLLYVLLGGMVSVVLTDYVQFIVLTVGIGATTFWVMSQPEVGGFSGVVKAVETHRGTYGLNPTIREPVLGTKEILGMGWVWIIWQCMHWMGTNTWQTQAFRTAATDSPRTTRFMWSLTAVNFFGRAIIPMLWGVAAIAFLSATLSPAEFDRVSTDNTLDGMPLLLKNLPAGLVGFMLAGMLAALMSTHSSYMLAWSGVLTEDLVIPIARALGINVPNGARIWITRFFILCLGAFLIGFGLWYEFKATVWGYLGVTGTMYVAGSMTLVAMGLYWRRANTVGAYCGLLCGAAPGAVYLASRFMVLGWGEQSPQWLLEVNDFMTDPATGIMSFPLGFLAMIIGSLLTGGGRSRDVSPMDDQLALAGASGGDSTGGAA
ncbi:MAG: sodium:solute symporter [Phycisphaerae bacterium]